MWSLENYIIHKLLLLLVGLIIVLNCICLMDLRLFSGSYFIAHTHYLRGIWHEQFGHVNYRYLQQLRKLNLLLGVPKPSCTDGVCLGVVLGKQQQNYFPKGKDLHATKPLELVHSDLMSFSTHSFPKSMYALTFIHIFSCTLGFNFISTGTRDLLLKGLQIFCLEVIISLYK